MKYVLAIFLSFALMSCGTVQDSVSNSDKTSIKKPLPPNTPSNKYSKKRQGGI